MKKIFKLEIENKKRDRVIDSIKHEVRKYIKREQKKALPKDTDFWFLDCKFGETQEKAKEIPLSSVIKSIDEAATSNLNEFYLEIIAKAKVRKKEEKKEELGEVIVEETK